MNTTTQKASNGQNIITNYTKNKENRNRTKNSKKKIYNFTIDTYQTQTGTSLTRDWQTVPRDGNNGIFGTVN